MSYLEKIFSSVLKINLSLVKNVKSTIFPIAWFDEHIEIDENTQNDLKMVALIVKIASLIPIVAFSFGFALAAIGSSIMVLNFTNKKVC